MKSQHVPGMRSGKALGTVWKPYGGIDEIEEVFICIEGMHHTDGEL